MSSIFFGYAKKLSSFYLQRSYFAMDEYLLTLLTLLEVHNDMNNILLHPNYFSKVLKNNKLNICVHDISYEDC